MTQRTSRCARLARRVIAGLWAGLFVTTASCAAAQTTDGVTPLSCDQANRVARGQDRSVPRGQGIAVLGRCPHQFAEVVPELWGDRTLSQREVTELRVTTREIRDRRVFEALVDAVQDPSKSVDVRLEALAILAGYVEGSFGLSGNDLLHARPGDLMPRTNHSTPQNGEQPTGEAEVAQAVGFFFSLAENGTPQEIRNAGQYLRQGLIARYAALMPLPTGSVTGTWDCQGHLTLENSGSYDVPLALVDSTGTKFFELSLRAPGSGVSGPYRVTPQFRRTGPMTVQFGGRPLLRFSCP